MVFSQLMEQLPWHTFRRCVRRYDGEYKVKTFRCSEQFRCMAFAQLTERESLRDIETCLRAQANKLPHLGIGHGVSRNTLANANRVRDWRIYEDFGQRLIQTAQRLRVREAPGLQTLSSIYALDSSIIDLSLNLYRWAHFRQTKSAVKLHALLDIQRKIPAFVHISKGKRHDVNILDLLCPEAGAVYIMDRAYLDFSRLRELDRAGAFFILRAKSNNPIATPVFQAGGPLHRTHLRPGGPVDRNPQRQRLPRPDPKSPLSGSGKEQDLGLPDQQFQPARFDYSGTVSPALAGRIVFQVDQTAPENQGVLRDLGQCGEDADLDRDNRIRTDRGTPGALANRGQPVHNATDLELDDIRESKFISTT